MIEYITGPIAELNPAYTVIDNHGIGYRLNISLVTFDKLQGVKTDVKLYVHEIIREDTHDLFGFFTTGERELFELMMSVSGVGANSARLILSSIPPGELENVIASGNERRLKSVKGIGAKTAQRIIVDLRDKIKCTDATLLTQSAAQSEAYEEALSALVMLGFPKPATQKVVTKLFKEDPSLNVESAIKKALTML
ncbi:MAG: Holliday junction branch migration protein RuvA [Muribaculaceae bacterium]|nr:Holliday junction branch migration protein RuvA [Muribaculaceae bacterium]